MLLRPPAKINLSRTISHHSCQILALAFMSVAQATKWGHAVHHAAKCRLQAQINVVEDLKICLGVPEHWIPDYVEYVKTLEYSHHWHFIHTIEGLKSLIVQHLFELSKANLASTGTF